MYSLTGENISLITWMKTNDPLVGIISKYSNFQMPTSSHNTHTNHFNSHFPPGKPGLASLPLILNLHRCLSWASSWDRPNSQPACLQCTVL